MANARRNSFPSRSPISGFLRALALPLRAGDGRTRQLAVLISASTCAALAIYRGFHAENFFTLPDVTQYLLIASGGQQVMRPFADRQLAALLAGAAAHVIHGTLEHSFIVEGICSLLVTVGAAFWLLARSSAPRWMLAAVALLPFWTDLFHNLGRPDPFYAALVAVLLLLLEHESYLAAAAMMLPLMLARESTLLTLLCFLMAAWRPLRWTGRMLALAAAAAGTFAVHLLTLHSLDNDEHLPQALYLLGKLPWNFARNVLGLQPWSNINRNLCEVPRWQFPLHLWTVQAVGACSYSSTEQLLLLDAALTLFGMLPALFAVLWWRRRRAPGSSPGSSAYTSPLLRFAVLYGALSFCLAPLLGTGANHLLGYSWPLFVVALPRLLRASAADAPPALAALGFFALHLIVVLAPFPGPWTVRLATKAVLWLAGFCLLARGDVGGSRSTGAAGTYGPDAFHSAAG